MRTAGRTILRRRQNERNITRDRKSETESGKERNRINERKQKYKNERNQGGGDGAQGSMLTALFCSSAFTQSKGRNLSFLANNLSAIPPLKASSHASRLRKIALHGIAL